MDSGKELLFEEKRLTAAKQVIINFPRKDENYFQVLDEEGNVKYTGLVHENPDMNDDCTCANFKPLNNEKWISTHGFSYQCKHLLKAREDRFGSVA